MKDPLDDKQRAYEVLGVTRNATLAEINAAYARLAAEKPSRRQELTSAWQRLRRPETRLEEDFWHYAAGEAQQAPEDTPDAGDAFRWEPFLPAVSLELTDLAAGRYRQDFGPLVFREPVLEHLDQYDKEPAAAIPISFDK